MELLEKRILMLNNVDEVSAFAVDKYRVIAEESVRERGQFVVAFSGGKTPEVFLQKLAMCQGLPWEHTHIFWVDERFVPFTERASNYRMVKENLLAKIDIPDKNVHPIYTGYRNLQTASRKYDEYLREFFELEEDELPVFDLVMLGLGEDGHTGSLFSELGDEMFSESLTVAVDVERVEYGRVSLGLAVINNARNIIFLVSGESKAEIVGRVVKEKDKSLPATHVHCNNGCLYYLVDKAAGAFIV